MSAPSDCITSTKPGKLVAIISALRQSRPAARPPSPSVRKAIAMRWSPCVAMLAPPRALPRPKMRSVSPSATAVTPQAVSPATMAPSRSLSLCPQFAQPLDHAFAVGEGAGDGQRRNFVDHRRNLRVAGPGSGSKRGMAGLERRRRFHPTGYARSKLDFGAHLLQRLKEAGAQRIDQHAADHRRPIPARLPRRPAEMRPRKDRPDGDLAAATTGASRRARRQPRAYRPPTWQPN